MKKNRVFTVTEIKQNPYGIFTKSIPFDVTHKGRVIASVVKPMGVWRECENCGENTQNILQYPDKTGVWKELTLCDKCANELL